MINFPTLMGFTSGTAFLSGCLLLAKARKVNLRANICLGLFMITLCLAILEIPLFAQNFHLTNPLLFEIIGLLRFLTAPLLYFSVVYFTSFEKKTERKDLLHLLPFLIFLIFRIPFFITGKNIDFSYQTGRIVFFILQIALPLQTAVYWCLSFIKLQKHIKNVKQFSSLLDKVNLNWLKSYLLIVLIILIVWLNLVFFNLKSLISYTPLVYVLSIFFLSFFSLKQEEVFSYSKIELKELATIEEYKKDSPKRVAGARLTELEARLKSLMEIEKVYLENDLSLPKLAGMLQASCNETSFLINERNQDNFYNFINKYRIEEAKKLLLSDSCNHLNIVGIAFESGFNSKTTFNTTFKKSTGYSPTAFIKASKTG
ncbi:helix-turn-helix domain-containing protein [Flavobacterium circumlabens]|uniref:Helix-turn-helix domain-containing protein n=1 Tax=Flavobacterium circumlabens TaxID=2133765 RepID=A0A4Y7UFT9_9FLAO|nr:helix-turn-helix domain-containing protein [Flavobacterium circumlabens]TCN60101.1 helix-turn-helix protein [Flavobacterium circumlabens]TEB45330.1 helix-turn-helix domain-containing protein [Flavobacterium circumlabens]